MKKVASTILFVQASLNDFVASKKTQKTFSLLKQTLEELGFVVRISEENADETSLDEIDILVAGIPEYLHGALNQKQIAKFLARGGSVLLLTNAVTMINPPQSINQVAELAGVRFKEYLNAPAPLVTRFYPHWITANVRELEPGKVATLSVSAKAKILAETDEPSEPFIVCATVDKGRMVCVGNETWLRNDYLPNYNNLQLLENIFSWLGGHNSIEIENVEIPSALVVEQFGYVTIRLRNKTSKRRANFKCILDSDAGAIITQPVKEKHGLPFNQEADVMWQIQPLKLGEQKLRLVIEQQGVPTMYFDRLPELIGEAPGYFTLETKTRDGMLQTQFQTGDHFIAEGMFHTTATVSNLRLNESLQLELGEGLLQRAFEPGTYKSRWHIQAAKAGNHEITLSLKGTKQYLPAKVQIQHSLREQIEEIETAIQLPLDAEISARLRQIDPILGGSELQKVPFFILSPDEYIRALYSEEAATRLEEILVSARREQWFNPELLRIILAYFLPTYVPNKGVYIPYDPDLASSLANLHPRDRWFLENNLLCSKESSILQVKQNVAAYLLHERYGHGFFYTHTRLGKQLKLLHRDAEKYKSLIQIIDDSSTIVNEGFATWLELHFLDKLDQEIRPVVAMRRDLLIERSNGMFDRIPESSYFQKYKPLHDSPYREGYELFDFISKTYNPRCVIVVMKITNDIDLGIEEVNEYEIILRKSESEIHEELLDPDNLFIKSNLKLQKITDYLRDNESGLVPETKKHLCPNDCLNARCPLEDAIDKQFRWRVI